MGIFLLSSLQISGQSFEKPWAIGLGGGAIKYLAHPGDNPLRAQTYHPIVSVMAGRYLSSGFDFRTQGTIGPMTQYPLGIEQTEKSYLFDMSYQLVFKLNNGVILKENGAIGPYGLVGIGGSFAPNHPDAYIPLGGGIKFRINHQFSLKLETIRKISLNRDYQNIEHAIAFIYNLPSKTAQIPEEPEPLKEELIAELLLPADTDLDGLIDLNDACPEVPGLVKYQGCPADPTPVNSEPSLVDVYTQPDSAILAPSTDRPEVPTYDPYALPEPELVITELSTTPAAEPVAESIEEQPSIPTMKTKEVKPAVELVCADAKAAITAIGPVRFSLGSDQLTMGALENLDDIAQILRSCPQARLVLQGHTDDSGNTERNLVLSIMRAYRVKYYLVYTHGISQQRIISDGLGDAEPLASNDSLIGRERNRRVDFTLIY